MEKIAYGGWPNCIRLTSGPIELIATTDVGPRIIRAGFAGGQNLFTEVAEHLGKTRGDEWRSYGGHRLWHAPETSPRTYAPDNAPVKADWDGKTLLLSQDVEVTTGIKKDIRIGFIEDGATVRVEHALTNTSLWDVTLAPWALSVMAQGGRAIIPQEDYRPHPEYLLPARPLVLWHYTNMSDPRWRWGEKYIQLKQDPAAGENKQKIGLLNKQGWTAYALNGDVFVKRFACIEGGAYPDYGCNNEVYTDGGILEVETLGALATLAAGGGAVSHIEHWGLFKSDVSEDEEGIDGELLPLVRSIPAVEMATR